MCNSACLFQVRFQADLDNQRWSGHQPGQALLGWRAWAKWKHLADSQQYSSGWQHQMRLLLALYLGRACLKGDSSRWKNNHFCFYCLILLIHFRSFYQVKLSSPAPTVQHILCLILLVHFRYSVQADLNNPETIQPPTRLFSTHC